MKIRQEGAELLYADGRTQTDMNQLTAAVRNFANAFKNRIVLLLHGLR